MAKRKPADATSPDQVFDEIAGLVAGFCREHLNEEYAVLCRPYGEKNQPTCNRHRGLYLRLVRVCPVLPIDGVAGRPDLGEITSAEVTPL